MPEARMSTVVRETVSGMRRNDPLIESVAQPGRVALDPISFSSTSIEGFLPDFAVRCGVTLFRDCHDTLGGILNVLRSVKDLEGRRGRNFVERAVPH